MAFQVIGILRIGPVSGYYVAFPAMKLSQYFETGREYVLLLLHADQMKEEWI